MGLPKQPCILPTATPYYALEPNTGEIVEREGGPCFVSNMHIHAIGLLPHHNGVSTSGEDRVWRDKRPSLQRPGGWDVH